MARSGIGCWVVASVGHLCRSCSNSILWQLSKRQRRTWFHPLVVLSIIKTKEAVHPSLIGWSSHLPSTVKMPDIQTGCARHHHLALFYRNWCIQDSPLASCGIGTCWTPHNQTLPRLGKNPSVHSLSLTTHQGCVLTDGFTLLLSFQRAILTIFGVWLAFHRTWPAVLFRSLG